MPELLGAAIESHKRSLIPPAALSAFYRDIVTAQLACLPKEPDHELLMSLVSSSEASVESGKDLGQTLDAAAMMIVAEALLKLLGSSFQRMKDREELKHNDEDYDEEAEARIKGENQAEDELNYVVAECVGSLMKIQKQAFVPAFTALLPHLEAWLGGPFGATKIALFIIDDFVQHCSGEAGFAFYPKLVTVLLTFATHARPEIRQAAAFGLGLCAENGAPPVMAPFLPAIIDTLKAQASHPQAREPANLSPTDNMVSSLLKVALNQQRPDLLQDWIMLLPLLADDGEAETNHDKLCNFLVQGAFEGPRLAHGARCLATILCDGIKTLETSEGLKQKMVETLRLLKSRPEVQQVLGSLPPAQQQQLSRLLESTSVKIHV